MKAKSKKRRKDACPACGSTLKHHIAKSPCTMNPHPWHEVGPVIAPIPGVMEPKPGTYHEMLRFISDQVKPAGAILFIINGVRGTGWECMGSPQVIADLPRLFRKVADEIEQTAHIRKVSGS